MNILICEDVPFLFVASRILHVNASKHSQVAHYSYSTPHCGLSLDTKTSPIYQKFNVKELAKNNCTIYMYILEDAYYLGRTPINLCTTSFEGFKNYNYVYKMWVEDIRL